MAAVDITFLCNLPVFWYFSFFFYFWGISKFVKEGFKKERRKRRRKKETEKFEKEKKLGKDNLDTCPRQNYQNPYHRNVYIPFSKILMKTFFD